MEITLTFDNLTGKELDDIAEAILTYLYDELDVQTTDYTVTV